jgi:ribokinase
VVVAGSLNWDLLLGVERLPRPGETVAASRSSEGAGGKGLNQAVAAARAGARVSFVGTVGDDAAGVRLVHILDADGVDTSGVRVATGIGSGLAVVQVDVSGANSIVVRAGANARTAPDALEAVALGEDDVLVAQAEIPLDAVAAVLSAGRRAGARTLLNLAPFHPLPAAALADVSVLVVNAHEAAGILGERVGERPPREVARHLVARGPDAAVVSLGEHGLAAATSDTEWLEPARRVVARDTTGAGDALVGVTAAALAEGADLATALRRGSAAAALAVQRDGASTSMPTRAEIDAELVRPQG